MSPQNSPPTLGVVAISRNEERDMPAFLEHLMPWVDEIVIVDDGSTDKTLEIIKSAGAKVKLIEHKMTKEGGFAQQRNIGLEAIQTDWVLNMDIDERVTPELAQEMVKAISDTELNGFRYRRLNFFAHRPMKAGGWASWNKPQLARRGFHHYLGTLHERCVVEGAPKSIGQLNGLMWHLNDESYQERMRKSFQYSLIQGERLLDRGQQITWADILTKPLLEFINKYILKRGFLDGILGLISAMHSGSAVFRANTLAWDEQNRIPREDLEKEFHTMWNSQSLEYFPHIMNIHHDEE